MLAAYTEPTLQQQIPAGEYAALVDLYNSTDGPNWHPEARAGWLDGSASYWYGVSVAGVETDSDGHVTKKGYVRWLLLHGTSFGSPNLNGTIPDTIGNLKQLEQLWLSSSQLHGAIPSTLGNLLALQELHLEYNQLAGPIPDTLGNLINLRALDLSVNQIQGPIPSTLGNLANLESIDCDQNELTGAIPASLGNLSKLRFLLLGYNHLTGAIPEELSNLASLQYLSLNNNELTGSIPTGIGDLSALEVLYISYNQLTGEIPIGLGNLSNLQLLSLEQNQLTGSVPSSLGDLGELRILYLSGNRLTGPLPASLGNLLNLEILFLGGNELTGSIPNSFGNFAHLTNFYLSDNKLSGALPASLLNLPKNAIIQIGGNFLNLEIGSPGRAVLDSLIAQGSTLYDTYQHRLIASMHRVEDYCIANASSDDIDMPLKPLTDELQLGFTCNYPLAGGVVADGVTPLLFKVLPDGFYSQYPLQVRISVAVDAETGAIKHGDIPSHLLILETGTFQSGERTVTLSDNFEPTFAYISGIPADDVVLANGATELKATLSVQFVDRSGEPLGEPVQQKFGIRKPPIVLIHGYNTTGTWSDGFKQTLLYSRPEAFVRELHYGVSGDDTSTNTFAPLSQLAAEVDGLLKAEVDSGTLDWRKDWALTRYDVVAHSQGGMLARMLCLRQKYSQIEAFRNVSNLQRGRFHRVITIGSPHNGSRLVRYMYALMANPGNNGLSNFIPHVLSENMLPDGFPILGALEQTLQPKFDPFGYEIRQLNGPGSVWTPDIQAKFRLLQTAIGGGPAAPGYLSLVPMYRLLNLASPYSGGVVLPNGSDGVVDTDSQGASAPDSPATFVSGVVAHSDPLAGILTLAIAGQTSSAAVALEVSELLDGLKPDKPFLPFVVPTLLDKDTVGKDIDEAAGAFTAQVDDLISQFTGPQRRSPDSRETAPEGSTSYQYQMNIANGDALAGDVTWTAEVFGIRGVTTDGVTLSVDPDDSRKVTVLVANGVEGEIVLYGSYLSVGGKSVFGVPVKVVSIAPAAAIAGIELQPKSLTVFVGAAVSPQVWGLYADGSRRRLYIAAGEAAFSSSNSAVVDVSGDRTFSLRAPGVAIVSVSFQGFTADATVAATLRPKIVDTRPVNISTRMLVGAEDNVLIAGFIITGNEPKKVILRGIGPSLNNSEAGVAGTLEDTMLELHDAGGLLLIANDDWRTNQEQIIVDTAVAPTDDRESAIVATLQPGSYTAVLRGKDGSQGIGLVEVYDLNTTATSQLAQISTRGFVQTGDDVMIGGFIISGTSSANVLVRAIGPELALQGVVNALEDTTLELHSGNGDLLAANDDWQSDQEQEIANTTVPPADPRESAIFRSVPTGNYTAIVRGKGNATGVGLVEVYNVQ